MLNDSRLVTFQVRDAVTIGFGASVDIHSSIDGRRKIGLGSLFSQVGA